MDQSMPRNGDGGDEAERARFPHAEPDEKFDMIHAMLCRLTDELHANTIEVAKMRAEYGELFERVARIELAIAGIERQIAKGA